MGCRKSIIGKKLAKNLGRRFLDLDSFIEKRAKCTISQLLLLYGDEGFRNVVSSVLEEVCLMQSAVVAVGEGTFAYEQNIVAAKNSGKIIYLQLPFNICYKRIKCDKKRPFVQKNEDELFNLFHKRHTIYKICANYIYEPILSPDYCAKQLAVLEQLAMPERG